MKEALKLALEMVQTKMYAHAEMYLKEALAQPAPQRKPVAWSSYEYDGIHHKPVAWMDADGNFSDNNDHKCFPIPLYTITHPTPPQRTWVGLTEEETQAVAKQARSKDHAVTLTNKLLKEKNNGLL